MTENYLLRQERTIRLLGREAQKKLFGSRVLVLGVGGVGGHAVECLVRAGIGHLTLMDGDRVDVTNCNRQLAALGGTIGRFKAEVLAERCREISPDTEVAAINEFLSSDMVPAVLNDPYDCVLDAIDDVPVKVAFLAECVKRDISVVSSMGAGGKLDPARVTVADIKKTFGCPLARAVRGRLRAAGVTSGIETVFSPEEAKLPPDGGKPGTVSYMPAIFGCFCASLVLRRLSRMANDSGGVR